MCRFAEILAFPALGLRSVPFCLLGPERVGEGRVTPVSHFHLFYNRYLITLKIKK